jgi:hypothetical protein
MHEIAASADKAGNSRNQTPTCPSELQRRRKAERQTSGGFTSHQPLSLPLRTVYFLKRDIGSFADNCKGFLSNFRD